MNRLEPADPLPARLLHAQRRALLGPRLRTGRGPAEQVHEGESVSCSAVEGTRPVGPWAWLLVVALMLPTELSVHLGGLRLSPYRVVLILGLVPTVRAFALGATKIRLGVDGLLCFGVFWALLAHAHLYPLAQALESGGIYALEALGAYGIARVFVNGPGAFERILRLQIGLLFLLALVAVPEAITGIHVFHEVAGTVFGGMPPTTMDERFGLTRVYSSFDHPILFGVFCAAWVGPLLALGASHTRRRLGAGSALAGVFLSISTGALLAAFIQVLLRGYRKLLARLPGRWTVLASGLLLAYVTVSLSSNRSGIRALTWYLSLNRHTAAYRLSIWEYGSASVGRHPWFGVGPDGWERPAWMSDSMDSFWLVEAVAWGLPCSLALGAAVLAAICAGRNLGARQGGARDLAFGWGTALLGLALAGFTVHFWNSLFVLFFFFVGCWSAFGPSTGPPPGVRGSDRTEPLGGRA